MENKFLRTFFVFLIIICSVNLVSAENVSQDINTAESIDAGIIIEPNAEIIYNFHGLYAHINIRPGDSYIDLNDDIVMWNDTGLYEEGIPIDKNVTIVNGIIDGANTVRIFDISKNGNLILENITLQNGYSSIGGGSILNMGMLTITGSHLKNNNVTGMGGAIVNVGMLTITSSYLNNNSATENGGAIVNVGMLTITDSYLNNNNAIKNGGAILNQGMLTITGSYLNNNSAREMGGVIVNVDTININDTYFVDNSAGTFGGSIYNSGGNIFVNGSVFVNGSAKYSGAIHSTDGLLKVYNSNFINISATETAGAIGLKGNREVIISNSTFLNTSSIKNAGAIFADYNALNQKGHFNNLAIYDSSFLNCSSGFGGAIVFLLGNLTINNSLFEYNAATDNGGAVYTSWANVIIVKSNFTSNKAEDVDPFSSRGGALFLDHSNNNISGSVFIDNFAMFGGAIYSYDANPLVINNNIFDNNQADYGDALYSEFDLNISLVNNNFNNDTVSTNNTHYISFFDSEGVNIEFINNSIILSNFPSKFDLRDFGWVTPVKNQGGIGACWTFGTSSALESALLKATGVEYSFSQSNMQNTMLQYSIYGMINAPEGGGLYTGVNYLVSWLGGLSIEYESYDELGKISPLYYNQVQVQDVIILHSKNLGDRDDFIYAIKDAIIKYGALELSYYAYQIPPYYNSNSSAQYSNETRGPNHSVAIVGWNDNFSKDNFLITPPGNGAFIFKNSWGTNAGDDGYFYLSYYDASIYKVAGFIFENDVIYNKNYQYDLSGEIAYVPNYTIYANQFVSESDDLIAAVGTYFETEGIDYYLEIYVNDIFVYNQSGITPFGGYHTIQLNEYIPIKEGDIFKVVMKSNQVPLSIISRVHPQANTSFVSGDGINWEDAYNKIFEGNYKEQMHNITGIISLKVYTVGLSILGDDLVKYYLNGSQFTARFLDDDGNPLDNQTMQFIINGVTYNKTTDREGYATLNINLFPGNYSIKLINTNTSYERSFNVRVLTTLFANDLTKYYLNGSAFNVKVLDDEGNLYNNTNVTIKINGKTYTKTTNSVGIATLNINLYPGEYVVETIGSNGLTLFNKITVIATLVGEDLNKTFIESAQYLVKVYDGKGKGLAKENVTININGVNYIKMTDNDGIARLDINLNPNSYIAYATWNGYTTTNKVNVI
ncbi:lectin like domain-containing protein [Methanobrevibacter sp. OttesenSCG-928-K11]|nr:lectin like domain-containing protein [Methanobrevibacter sp. OttesenSCG-928-K11]MDL2270180.1 lectin like domain-containing protein [Methanobrevibacter sp. OttesenSCG-928-I08]